MNPAIRKMMRIALLFMHGLNAFSVMAFKFLIGINRDFHMKDLKLNLSWDTNTIALKPESL